MIWSGYTFIAFLTDGIRRQLAADYVATLQRKVQKIGWAEIATVIGRYYAMDRDKRWERTKRAISLSTPRSETYEGTGRGAIRQSYLRGIWMSFRADSGCSRRQSADSVNPA